MMKLPQAFISPHKNAMLVIVAGRNVAKLYIRTRNSIEELAVIHVPVPKYSDRERYFQSRAPGVGKIRAGAVYEAKKQTTVRKFTKELRGHVKRILQRQKVSGISISVPRHLHYQVVDALPQYAQRKITYTLDGNYTQKHPLDIIRMFEKRART